MAIIIEVDRNQNENTLSLIRRFSRRVRGAGIINRVRSLRYYQRSPSKALKRKNALKSLERRQERQELIKLGKIVEPTPRHRP
jgi:ribosomal protein S21